MSPKQLAKKQSLIDLLSGYPVKVVSDKKINVFDYGVGLKVISLLNGNWELYCLGTWRIRKSFKR